MNSDNRVSLEKLQKCKEYFDKQDGRKFPCSNQIVVCAIITKDTDKAFSIMEKKGAIIKRRSRNHIEWELNNERWLWTNWNMNHRGYRFYKIIVDEDVDEDLFEYAISYSGFYCCSMEIM